MDVVRRAVGGVLPRSITSLFSGLSRNQIRIAAAVLVLLVFKSRRDAAIAARKWKKQKKAAEGGTDVPKKKRAGASVSKLWATLFPSRFSLTSSRASSAGSKEIAAMFGLCLARIWIMNRMSEIVKGLDANMMTRNQTEFWDLFKQATTIAGISVLHRNTYKYVENTLGVVWQEKLTDLIHRLYFDNMAYYHVASGAALGSDLNDPDERIVQDAKDVSTQMATIFCEAMYSSTAGVFFAYKLGRLYGVRYAVAPYVYLWAALTATQTLAPINWGKELGGIRSHFGKFRDRVFRLFHNQEAIAALQGAPVEGAMITEQHNELHRANKEVSVKMIWPNFLQELTFTWWSRTFVGMFVIGPHVIAPAGHDLARLADLSVLRGNIGHQFVLFVQSMISAGVTAKMIKQWQKLAGSAGRVQELVDRLQELKESRTESKVACFEEGDRIEFKDVKVVTPTGNTLVDKLSFVLERGSSVLLTGHNGAGKSSIFRCLGGLWDIPEGKITKPGSAASGLHQDVFYLPQKPYNVLGTLRDQLTYPEQGIADVELSREVLVDILDQVNLAHLVDRPGVLEQEINWEEELSLGEKQRLAIARLIYHKPRFAVLDECTSAVSGEMERYLYYLCRLMNVTYITISHRPVLKTYHEYMLTIGDGKAGFTFERITEEVHVLPAERTVTTAAPADMTASVVLDKAKKTERSVYTRLKRLLSIGLPRGASWRMVAIIVGIMAQSRLLIQHTSAVSGLMTSVFQQDKDAFYRSCMEGISVAALGAMCQQMVLKLQRDLEYGLQRGLTKSFVGRLVDTNQFYKLTQVDGRVTDAEQRITADVRDFSSTISNVFPQLIKPLVDISWFIARLHVLVGPTSTKSFLAYLSLGALLIRLVIPNFQSYVRRETALEGKFKLVHSRVRSHAESIAFFGGDEREHAIVSARFQDLMRTVRARLRSSWLFGLVNQAVIREAPMLVQWQLRNEYGRKWGSDEDVRADAGVTLNKNQLFIFEATNYTFDALGQILSFGEKFANLSGFVVRLAELDEALNDIASSRSGKTDERAFVSSDSLSFEGTDVITPTGQVLARDMCVTIPVGESLMVTGPNGSGKTGIFRLIGGLWPVSNGTVSRPLGPQGQLLSDDVFLVPQRTYLCGGTLADQLSYPKRLSKSDRDEQHLVDLLDLVGIAYLKDREGGFDAVVKWEDVLSLGEQQRLSMARLFFHTPRYAVLDECTSAVSVDVEEKLYREAARLGLTCITMSQRLALHQFHKQELRLGEETAQKWSVRDITCADDD